MNTREYQAEGPLAAWFTGGVQTLTGSSTCSPVSLRLRVVAQGHAGAIEKIDAFESGRLRVPASPASIGTTLNRYDLERLPRWLKRTAHTRILALRTARRHPGTENGSGADFDSILSGFPDIHAALDQTTNEGFRR